MRRLAVRKSWRSLVREKIMKSLTDYLWFEILNRRGFVNITDSVERLSGRAESRRGLDSVEAVGLSGGIGYLKIGAGSGEVIGKSIP